MLEKYSLMSIDSADDLSLLCEVASSGRYNLHIQHAIKKLYGALFLILRGFSYRRVYIVHKVFVSYSPNN